MESTDTQARQRSRLVLAGIAALFVAPILLAGYLNSTWSRWAPAVTRNHGELLEPVAPLPASLAPGWQDRAGGRWTLIAVDADCDGEACRGLMDTLYRVHRALGRRGDRLRRMLVVESAPAAGVAPDLVTVVDDAAADDLALRWGADTGLLLVDPLGNVMMRYPVDFDPSGLRKDLERLFKYSKVGT